MLSGLATRQMIENNENLFGDDLEREIGLLLREPRPQANDFEKELNIFRSGSAPPTVEGSLSAVSGLFNHGFAEFARNRNGDGFMSEEELRSDPAYLSYYYSNVNLNPRLPPPLLSKEDWRFAQRLRGSSVVGDKTKINRNENAAGGRSLLPMPPGFNSKKHDVEVLGKVPDSVKWPGDGLIGLPGLGLVSKQKSLADLVQDDLSRAVSRPASRNTFNSDSLDSAEVELASLRGELSTAKHGVPPGSYSHVTALGASLSRSTTPDTYRISRAPSPSITPIGSGRPSGSDKKNTNNASSGISSHANETADLVAGLSSMNLSNGDINENLLPQLKKDDHDHDRYEENAYLDRSESGQLNTKSMPKSAKAPFYDDVASNNTMSQSAILPSDLYPIGSPTYAHHNDVAFVSQYQHFGSPTSSFYNNVIGGQPMSPVSGHLSNYNLPPLFENAAAASIMGSPGIESLNGTGSTLQMPYMDPMYFQYFSTPDYFAAQVAPSFDQNYSSDSYMEFLGKAYLGTLQSPQKSQYGPLFGSKSNGCNDYAYYGNPTFGVDLSYPASPVLSNSHIAPVSSMRSRDFNKRFTGKTRNLNGGVMGPWHLDNMNSFAPSLLEEFKCNKTRCFELSDIVGHVVEFSADQYGSRFIQQKLETATSKEKSMVFEEINPEALTLMTDVFGNYVIQKFFEHGMPSQRRELADKLFGHVLTLGLQMYGCRVIQKAIEVVDEDQKIIMVGELEGHVMRCVRDQNGNHVIQKCIECVPEEHVHFIVSTFFGHVVSLSMHPYGCRVIQRVLEHCKDPNTQTKVMEEILGSVSMLAQDQYGNYVIQHVLEHGKPDERSVIIQELAGKIVLMSQQKFASNVVEKCLAFGDPTERQLLVKEMLGSPDDNEPLKEMMKDQFGNYVVQKVLETCNDQQREMILSRIKIHLSALKKYTYGKHIVARLEKLVTAGERRVAAQSVNAS